MNRYVSSNLNRLKEKIQFLQKQQDRLTQKNKTQLSFIQNKKKPLAISGASKQQVRIFDTMQKTANKEKIKYTNTLGKLKKTQDNRRISKTNRQSAVTKLIGNVQNKEQKSSIVLRTMPFIGIQTNQEQNEKEQPENPVAIITKESPIVTKQKAQVIPSYYIRNANVKARVTQQKEGKVQNTSLHKIISLQPKQGEQRSTRFLQTKSKQALPTRNKVSFIDNLVSNQKTKANSKQNEAYKPSLFAQEKSSYFVKQNERKEKDSMTIPQEIILKIETDEGIKAHVKRISGKQDNIEVQTKLNCGYIFS